MSLLILETGGATLVSRLFSTNRIYEKRWQVPNDSVRAVTD